MVDVLVCQHHQTNNVIWNVSTYGWQKPVRDSLNIKNDILLNNIYAFYISNTVQQTSENTKLNDQFHDQSIPGLCQLTCPANKTFLSGTEVTHLIRKVVWALSSRCFISSHSSTPELTSLLTPSFSCCMCDSHVPLISSACSYHVHSIVQLSGMWEIIHMITQVMENYNCLVTPWWAKSNLSSAATKRLKICVKTTELFCSKWKIKIRKLV